jgi:PAS domain S-box-containing protein
MEFLSSFMGRNGFLPHGICLQWSPALLWSMVGADVVIALAYFSIPLAILSFVRQRGAALAGYGALPWLFSAFIFACGLTHVLDIWTLWQPDYGLLALSKIATAGVSAATALALWPLIPRALNIPSVAQLQGVISELQAEVGRRRTAEEHARDLEQSLVVTLTSIEAGFVATDAQGLVTRLNPVAERLTGWPQAEARGRSLWEVLQREGRPADWLGRNPVQVAIEQGTTVDQVHEVVVLARDGARRLVEARAAVTRNDAGEVQGLVAVFRDITLLRQAEADLPRLAAIVESSDDAIIGKTLEGRITTWNRAAEQMFGYSAAEAIGQPVQMLFPPGQEADEMALLARLARDEHILPFDAERRAKDGRVLQVSVTSSPIHDRNGRVVGASKIVRDLSHLRRAEAALRESDFRLRFALETAQIGDWDFDLETGFTRRSIRHDRCFGYTELQPTWSFDVFLRHVHPLERHDVALGFWQALADGSGWQSECRVVWPDGSVHWISLYGSVLEVPGRPSRMLGIVTDITRKKRDEEARVTAQRLEAENRQIQESSRMKSQFLANMSHELRTPLNAIIGFAELLHAGVVPVQSAKHHEFLGHIAGSGRHLLQLINDVLDLSKVESGRFEFFPEAIELPRLVADVAGVLHTALQAKHLQLSIDIDADIGALRLDPARLKQALYNYLSNAIKFTPDGGRITVRAAASGARDFRLEVEDSGIGIAPNDLGRLFVEFQQLDTGYSKRHQGTGLGLALTRRLVQAQGGSVGVRSEPGVGSVFHLVLPRLHQPSPTAEGAAGPTTDGIADLGAAGTGAAAAAAPTAGLAGAALPLLPAANAPVMPSMLLIEHDAQLQSGLATPLREAGFRIDVAPGVHEARHHAAAHAYDAMTLSLLLPDQRGLAVLAEIRSRGASRESPVLGLSLALGEGASAAFSIANVLAKPIRSDEVLQAMAGAGLSSRPGARVMVIDDDPLALDLMRATLHTIGIEATGWLDSRQALLDIDSHRPDAIVLDLMMPGCDGFEVLAELGQRPAWRAVPVFIWTSMLLTDDEYALLAQSARAVLAKGGGAAAALVERLRSWRPQGAMAPSERVPGELTPGELP